MGKKKSARTRNASLVRGTGNTTHCQKAVLKFKETVSWNGSLVEDLESREDLLTSFLQEMFRVWTLFCPVSHTLAINKTHNTATKDHQWLHLYIFGAIVTILDSWPCSLQPKFSQLLSFSGPKNKQQTPKWIIIHMPSYEKDAVQ